MPLYVTPISGIAFAYSTVNDPGFGTTTNPARIVTALNTSGIPVTIGTITVSNPVFGILTDNCSGVTLQPSPNAGDSCTLSLNFTASAVGSFSGTLSIPSNASNSPNTMTLSGTGLAGLINQSVNVTFPNTIVGNTSATKTVTMSNLNPTPDQITVSGVSLVNTCGISITTDGCTGTTLGPKGSTGPVPPAASCTIGVVFAPTGAGSCTEVMQVTSDGGNSPSSITLQGNGTLLSPTACTEPACVRQGAGRHDRRAAGRDVHQPEPGWPAIHVGRHYRCLRDRERHLQWQHNSCFGDLHDRGDLLAERRRCGFWKTHGNNWGGDADHQRFVDWVGAVAGR